VTNNEIFSVEQKMQDKNTKRGFDKWLDYECGEDVACKRESITTMVKEGAEQYYKSHAPDMSIIMIFTGGAFVCFLIILLLKRYYTKTQ